MRLFGFKGLDGVESVGALSKDKLNSFIDLCATDPLISNNVQAIIQSQEQLDRISAAIANSKAITGLPKPVLDKLVQNLLELDKNPGWRNATERIGSIPYIKGPKEATEFAKTQYETYLNLGKRLNIIDKLN